MGAFRTKMNARRASCTEVDEKLPLFVGGDLDAGALESVRSHLALCEACARKAGEATRAREALRSAFRAREAETPAPRLWPGIRATLAAEGLIGAAGRRPEVRPAPGAAVRARPRPRLARLAVPLAAAAALVALVYASGFLRPDPAGVTPEKALLVDGTVEDAGTLLVPVGGLRRVAPDEEDLFRSALPPQRRERAPGLVPDPTLPGLAGYR